jgi:hypothetical protein
VSASVPGRCENIVLSNLLYRFSWASYVLLNIAKWAAVLMMCWLILRRHWGDALVSSAILGVLIFWNWFTFTRYNNVNKINLEPKVAEALNRKAQSIGIGTEDFANKLLAEVLSFTDDQRLNGMD